MNTRLTPQQQLALYNAQLQALRAQVARLYAGMNERIPTFPPSKTPARHKPEDFMTARQKIRRYLDVD